MAARDDFTDEEPSAQGNGPLWQRRAAMRQRRGMAVGNAVMVEIPLLASGRASGWCRPSPVVFPKGLLLDTPAA